MSQATAPAANPPAAATLIDPGPPQNKPQTEAVNMNAKKLDQFYGPLNATQVADGMNAARRNALRLANDASFLLEHKRFASAVAFAILSIEESGKLSILRQLATAQSAEQIKKYWREYRSHTKKNIMWTFCDLFAKGAHRLDEFAPLFALDAEHPQLLDNLKQISLYSDCLGNAHWSEPADVIDESLAKSMVFTARFLRRTRNLQPWKSTYG